MIFLVPFIALIIWKALFDSKPEPKPLTEQEKRELFALVDQMEYDRMVEFGKVARAQRLKQEAALQEKINQLCKESIDKLTAQFEKGELTQQEYDEGLDALFNEMKIISS